MIEFKLDPKSGVPFYRQIIDQIRYGIASGKLKVGDKIIIKPGINLGDMQKPNWQPLRTEIVGLMTGTEKVKEVVPGGSIAIMTELDPKRSERH